MYTIQHNQNSKCLFYYMKNGYGQFCSMEKGMTKSFWKVKVTIQHHIAATFSPSNFNEFTGL